MQAGRRKGESASHLEEEITLTEYSFILACIKIKFSCIPIICPKLIFPENIDGSTFLQVLKVMKLCHALLPQLSVTQQRCSSICKPNPGFALVSFFTPYTAHIYKVSQYTILSQFIQKKNVHNHPAAVRST